MVLGAVVLLVVYLAALEAWPVGQARALVFTALLASQPALLLSMTAFTRIIIVLALVVVAVATSVLTVAPAPSRPATIAVTK